MEEVVEYGWWTEDGRYIEWSEETGWTTREIATQDLPGTVDFPNGTMEWPNWSDIEIIVKTGPKELVHLTTQVPTRDLALMLAAFYHNEVDAHTATQLHTDFNEWFREQVQEAATNVANMIGWEDSTYPLLDLTKED